MTIEGIPDGWELVRIGKPFINERYISLSGNVTNCVCIPSGEAYAIVRKIRKIEKPKQYRPFANAAEYEPFRDRWVYSSEQRSDNAEGAESPEDEHSKVLAYGDHGVTIQDCSFCFDTAFRYFVFSDDGTPFGIEVTE